MSKIRIIGTVLIASILAGCSTTPKKDEYQGMSVGKIYSKGKKRIQDKKFTSAIKDFEAIEARFPYGELSEKSQLGLIYAHYKKNDAASALAAIERFIRMYPKHPQVDYVHYMKGLVHHENYVGTVTAYLPVDKSARDVTEAKSAFDAFKTLINKFPNSEYLKDARQRMVFLRNEFAKHEIHVAEYYMKREAYLAAANRASYVVKHFDKTTSIPDALVIMHKAYSKLGMQTLAKSAFDTLKVNFPGTETELS